MKYMIRRNFKFGKKKLRLCLQGEEFENIDKLDKEELQEFKQRLRLGHIRAYEKNDGKTKYIANTKKVEKEVDAKIKKNEEKVNKNKKTGKK